MIKKKKNFHIKPYFSFRDSRGLINGIFNSFKIEEANIITSKAKTIRGKHYHKKTIEILYVVQGCLQIYFSSVDSKEKILKKINLKTGQTIKILPYQFHWTYNKKKAQWINFLTKKFDKNRPDIHI